VDIFQVKSISFPSHNLCFSFRKIHQENPFKWYHSIVADRLMSGNISQVQFTDFGSEALVDFVIDFGFIPLDLSFIFMTRRFNFESQWTSGAKRLTSYV
jgi:hypothetical protein